jgi:hypothetical protein
MSAITFTEYAQAIQALLNEVIRDGSAQVSDIRIDPRSIGRGYIAGSLLFQDASELHFREFVDVSQPSIRLMYAYHYQDSRAQLIFRYDNAAHKPSLPQADHKHTPDSVELCAAPTLAQVQDEVL